MERIRYKLQFYISVNRFDKIYLSNGRKVEVAVVKFGDLYWNPGRNPDIRYLDTIYNMDIVMDVIKQYRTKIDRSTIVLLDKSTLCYSETNKVLKSTRIVLSYQRHDFVSLISELINNRLYLKINQFITRLEYGGYTT